MAFLPILKVDESQIPERVLVVGDPGRLELVAKELKHTEVIGENREYKTMTGTFEGVDVAIISHGVGSAGAGVCFEEICRSNVKRIIRAGTAGGMQKEIKAGELVIAKGAVREDGLSGNLVPSSFPALASPKIVALMGQEAKKKNRSITEGIVLTSDMFYPHEILGSNLPLWQRAGVKAVEMEVATLFVICELRDVESGAILAIDGNPLEQDEGNMVTYDPHTDIVEKAMRDGVNIALKVLIS